MQFYTSADIPADLAEESFAANLIRLAPNGKAQLFGLSGLAKTRTFSGITHSWWTKKARFPQVTLSADAASNVTTLPITDVAGNADENLSHIVPNNVLRVAKITGTTINIENLYVTAVNRAANTIEVLRGYGNTTPLALVSGDLLIKIGNAHAQGSDVPNPVSVLQDLYSNQTQIFRDSWATSRTLALIAMRAGDGAVKENRTDAMHFHGSSIEETLLFGQKGTTTDADGAPITTMAGIEQIIRDQAPQNLNVAPTSGVTFDMIEEFLDPLLDNKVDGMNSMDHKVYCGKTALKTFNKLAKQQGVLEVTQGETTFGQRFVKFQTTRGNFELIEHPLLNTNPVWAAMAIAIDPSGLDIMYLSKTFEEEIKGSGKDAKAGVFTTELTLEVKNPFAMGIIYNLVAVAQ